MSEQTCYTAVRSSEGVLLDLVKSGEIVANSRRGHTLRREFVTCDKHAAKNKDNGQGCERKAHRDKAQV